MDHVGVDFDEVRGPQKTYEFTRWSGRKTRVAANRIESLHGGGLAFWTGDRLELAVKDGDWNDLQEIGEA